MMRIHRSARNRYLVATVSCSALLLGSEAIAQVTQKTAEEQTPAARDNDNGDIVVTAQKRAETIQNVPLSLTAFSNKDLQERRVYQLSDISAISPSVSFIGQGGGREQLVIRGLAAGSVPNDKPTVSPLVGIYLDDIAVATALRNPDFQPVDLQRIEILRGPQGTLYGNGALGGAIKLVTNPPNYQAVDYGGSIEGSITHRGGLGENFTGYLNIPIISDTLAIRAVAYHRFAPGYVTNLVTHNDHGGDFTSNGGRVEIGLKPIERLEIIGKIIYQRAVVGPGYEQVSRDVDFNGLPVRGLNRVRFSDEKNVDTIKIYNLTSTYDLGSAQITSLTSHIDRKVNSKTDFTGYTSSFAPGILTTFFESVPIRETSQELRISSSSPGRFKWTVGGLYSDSKRSYPNVVSGAGFDAASGIDTVSFGSPFDDIYDASNKIHEVQKAIFGEATFDLTSKLSFTAGARAYDVKQHFNQAVSGFFNGGVSSTQTLTKSRAVNPRFIASFKPDKDILVSAQASKGFRLGGGDDFVPFDFCRTDLNALGINSAPRSFKSETVWNYELNAKTRFGNGRFTFNPTIYREDYSNIQVVQSLPTCFFAFVGNGGKARSQGIELDASATLSKGLTLRLGGAYTDAKLLSDPVGFAGQRGDRLPLSPRLSGNAQLRYEVDLAGDRRAFGQVEARYVGNILTHLYDPDSTIAVPPNLGAYTLVNLRAGIFRKSVEWAVFADNITDRRAYTSAEGPAAIYGITSAVTRPRVIGFSITFNKQ